jgi:hypothetical protein
LKKLSVLLLALVALLAGCKVDTAVIVDVHDDGSGTVTVRATLDPEAVRAAEADGGHLEDRVRLADLSAAGWTVSPWVRSDAGSAQVELTKPFTSPDQVAAIVNEVNGPNGPLRGIRARRDRGAASTSYEVTGGIDMAAMGTGVTADQDLVNSLAGAQVDVGKIDQALLTELRNAVSVSVVVKLPDGTTTTVNGQAGTRVPVDVSASVLDTRRLGLLAVSIVLIALAIGVLMIGRRRRRARAPIPRFGVHSRGGETMR